MQFILDGNKKIQYSFEDFYSLLELQIMVQVVNENQLRKKSVNENHRNNAYLIHWLRYLITSGLKRILLLNLSLNKSTYKTT